MGPMSQTTTQPGELEVRDARAEDREAVFAFCARTWGDEGDYISQVWDEWLSDTAGALLVGVADGQPIALSHVRMTAPDEAWIEGVRVADEARRQGVGHVMVSRSLVRARELGASVARMFTEASNSASIGLFEGFGFTRVAQLSAYSAPALTDDPEATANAHRSAAELDPTIAETTYDTAEGALPTNAQLRAPGPDEFPRLWDWLVQSNLTPFNGGLEIHHWTGRGVSEPALREYLAAGEVVTLDEWGTIQALAIICEDTVDGPELEVRYIDGLSEAIGRLALLLREETRRRGLERVWLWAPDLLILRDAMNGAGYTCEVEAMHVFARAL